MAEDILAAIQENCTNFSKYSRPDGQLFFVIRNGGELENLAKWLKGNHYYLFNLTANDERRLETHAYQLYYTFSGGSPRKLVTLGYPLESKSPTQFPSLHTHFPTVRLLEQQIYDLHDLSPIPALTPSETGVFLHRNAFPPHSAPLARKQLEKWLSANGTQGLGKPEYLERLAAGETVSVGPIHAGIIGGGLFLFRIKKRPIIEEVRMVLGFQHRGIQKLFQSRSLLAAPALAELVAGDASVAYGEVVCRAIENLIDLSDEIPKAAQLYRALLLELERIASHIGDIGNSFQGIAATHFANRILSLSEAVFQLNQRITCARDQDFEENGNSLLRGINCVGGVAFPKVPDLCDIESSVRAITDEFIQVSLGGLQDRDCDARFFNVGILSRPEAEKLATGLPARASGCIDHDFRRWHPYFPYSDPEIQCELNSTITENLTDTTLNASVFKEKLEGDVKARLALRVAEVETSARIIFKLIEWLRSLKDQSLCVPGKRVREAIDDARDYDFGTAAVECWRGEIACQIWKGPGDTIFNLDLRDPSFNNWQAMAEAVKLNPLPDFPAINKSFNNSYPAVSG